MWCNVPISLIHSLLFPVSLLWSRCNWQDRFTCVWELKWPPIYMTGLPMGTTSMHQTFVSSSHIAYYHQLAQVCHPLNIFSGELGLDHWHNGCCNAAYTSLSTVPVNYTVVVRDTSAMAMPHIPWDTFLGPTGPYPCPFSALTVCAH